MGIFFTICANNYLAEALTLGQSLISKGLHAGAFKIFLVDKKNDQIDYAAFDFEVIEINEAMVPGFDSITVRYRIVELSTAVKPSLLKWLIKTNPTETFFSYLDPDLYFFDDVSAIYEQIGEGSILLTPHILQPVALDKKPFENLFLNYGIYNLGFITIRNDNVSKRMLDWWEERTMNLGYDQPANGIFVDQLWINLVPIFFDNVRISKHAGFNCAFWNIHERCLSERDGRVFVNEIFPLVFFHFSSFTRSNERISKGDYTNPEGGMNLFFKIADGYKEKLNNNRPVFFKSFKPAYYISFENHMQRMLPTGVAGSTKVKLVTKLKRFLPHYLMQRIANTNTILQAVKNYKK